jgi:hypothetical protein
LSNHAETRTRRIRSHRLPVLVSKVRKAIRTFRDRKLRSSQDRSSASSVRRNSELNVRHSRMRVVSNSASSVRQHRRLNVLHGQRRSRLKASVLAGQSSGHTRSHNNSSAHSRSSRNSKDHLPLNPTVVAVKAQAAVAVARVKARSLNFRQNETRISRI